MKSIEQLVRTDFKKINRFTATIFVKDHFSDTPIVLVDDDEAPIGILSNTDLQKTHNIIVDCLSKKPIVYTYQNIDDVLDLMQRYRSEHFLVNDKNIFVGTISKDDITLHLRAVLHEHHNLLYDVTHDLKSPIANIATISDILLSDHIEEKDLSLLNFAQIACNHAVELIEDLLALAESNRPTSLISTDITALIFNCIHINEISARKKNISLMFTPPFMNNKIECNTLMLKRAINNIISNAIKFTAAHGSIEITVTNQTENVIITITDNGIGIPDSLQPFLFDRFSKAKRRGTNNEQSTGLGMFIVKKIISDLQGSIDFATQVDKGTTFFIRLPVANKLT